MGLHAAATRRLLIPLGLSAGLTCRVAAAQAPADPVATAAALFDEAKEMMDKGNNADACPKLAESQALDPQVGTMLNLAACYESVNKFASACAVWREAAVAAARKMRPDREELARQRAEGTCPRAPQVTVQIAEQPERDRLQVTLNGAPVPMERWGLPTPIDPGDYEIRVTSEGTEPWTRTFRVAEQEASVLVVPALTPLAPEIAPTPIPPPAPSGGSRSIGPAVWVAGGVGLAAIGFSAAFGAAALGKMASSSDGGDCVRNNCNPAGADARSRAKLDADVSDVTLAIGVGALATGAILWLVSPRTARPASGAYVQPAVSQSVWSVSVGNTW
jgi:hypothetical protein